MVRLGSEGGDRGASVVVVAPFVGFLWFREGVV